MARLVRALLLLWVIRAQAEDAVPAAPVAPPSPPIPGITVETPEPRFVAPTRRDRIGRIWAPVYLNGRGPFRLVLDTGANRSVVVQRVAEALGPAAHTSRTARVRGVTGVASFPMVRVERMDVGDLVMEPAYLPVVEDVFGGAEGVLGNEGLRDKRIVIDFKRDFISVKRSRYERPGPGFETLPITLMRDQLLAIDVWVGGVRARAIIDTGAPDSLGNLALLEALKKQPAEDPGTQIVGVTLDVELGDRVRMPTIRLQGIHIRGAVLTFGDVTIFHHWRMTREPVVLLGMDVLGVLEQLIIDYRGREVHMLATRPQDDGMPRPPG